MADRLSIDAALTAANFSSLAYKDSPFQTGCQMINLLPERDVQCLVVREATRLTFAFRGTADMRAWFSNAAVTFKTVMACRTPVKVHTGFWDDVSAIWPRLLPLAQEASLAGLPIYTTGHSKGAGECRLFTLMLASNGIEVAESITFGEPRSLSKAAAKLYTNCNIPTFRIVDEADVVCRIPWLLGLYRHVGLNCYIDKWGQMQFGEPWYAHLISDTAAIIGEAVREEDALIYDHGVGLYVDRLQTIKKQFELDAASFVKF